MSDYKYKRGYSSSSRSRRSRSRSRSYSPDNYRKRSPDDYRKRSPDNYTRKRSPDDYKKSYYDHKSRSSTSPSRYASSKRDKDRKERGLDNEFELPQAPPPPSISKPAAGITMSLSKFKAPKPGIQLKLAGPPKKETAKPVKVASVFGNDSDDEPEEMPAECKMRMRNIGRDTPTSSGPNSFGKTKQGFCDSKKIFEKKLKEMAAD